MDLRIPLSCSPCSSIRPNQRNRASTLAMAAKSQLQMDSAVTSTQVPTHSVTVHDRKRGVVHTFSVPEGYALLCVGFPSTDVEVETQDEDEVYWLQFGRYFARGPIDRDDYALELAMGDE
ncbi:hypothetical protein QJS04_geneDACA015745 [Acorus gramineus]|uniref:Uncharacterized protein n=1 Tax=Acorus gramineus TaxID=55184 RepID=A0AAV9BQC0_ACOGR|nr:hypothetical protein QJS04_geneDACA015745 [Acorus gramineus]